MVCKICPRPSGSLGNDSSWGFAPLGAAAIEKALAEQGLARVATTAAAEGSLSGALRGALPGAIFGALLGLGTVAWAFWRARPEDTPILTIRASSTTPTEPPAAAPVALLPTAPTPSNDDIALDFAKIVSGPFTTQAAAEAELIRHVATETKVHSAPYAVIHDTHTGYFYVCEILGNSNVTSSFHFVSYGVKLGDKQSEADAIPPLEALVQASGDALRVIGVWSESQYVITTTTPITNTPSSRVVVFKVVFELHNQEKLKFSEQVMLTFPDKSYIKLFIAPSDLQNILRNGIVQEVRARLSVLSFNPITQEPSSTLATIKLRVRPGIGAVTVDVPSGVKSTHIEYYTSGDTRLRIPSSPGKPIPVYLPVVK